MSEEPLSQQDIDAALSGLTGEEAAKTPPSPQPSNAGSSTHPASAGGPSSSAEPFKQDDIDSLLNSAASLAEEVKDVVKEVAGSVGDSRVDSAGRPFDDVASAIAAEMEQAKASASIPKPNAPSPSGASPFDLPDFGTTGSAHTQTIDLLKDVGLQVKIELGRCRMFVDEVMRLGEGSVVELEKLAGDPVDVYVNDRLVARGEVLVLNDNFCVRVNEIVAEITQDFQTA